LSYIVASIGYSSCITYTEKEILVLLSGKKR